MAGQLSPVQLCEAGACSCPVPQPLLIPFPAAAPRAKSAPTWRRSRRTWSGRRAARRAAGRQRRSRRDDEALHCPQAVVSSACTVHAKLPPAALKQSFLCMDPLDGPVCKRQADLDVSRVQIGYSTN